MVDKPNCFFDVKVGVIFKLFNNKNAAPLRFVF